MTEKKKKKAGMGPGLKRFIKKHKRFPKTPAERREAGTMTKQDKARSRSSPKPRGTKKKATQARSKKTSRKTTKKKTHSRKNRKWVF